jgi:hypothetical protein
LPILNGTQERFLFIRALSRAQQHFVRLRFCNA